MASPWPDPAATLNSTKTQGLKHAANGALVLSQMGRRSTLINVSCIFALGLAAGILYATVPQVNRKVKHSCRRITASLAPFLAASLVEAVCPLLLPSQNLANRIERKGLVSQQNVLFLRPSASIFPFLPTDRDQDVWPLEYRDYSGVFLSPKIVQSISAIAVHCKKTGNRLPLSIGDTSSSPTKLVADCLEAVRMHACEWKEVRVYLLVDGVSLEDREAVEQCVRNAWRHQDGLSDELRDSLENVTVLCYPRGELLESQQQAIFNTQAPRAHSQPLTLKAATSLGHQAYAMPCSDGRTPRGEHRYLCR